ncbi:ABC transporter ATP-binding protein [Jiangella anatolica]|uniref:ABC transporter ATP-binding protein n=1 Tax=Jiangella anatolica TaxID=2670374 RepID=UPI0011B7E6A5|nr:ABC transporter ATP-binding protein [Jiangella anatolica]
MTASTAIRVRGLRRAYAGVPAVDGLDLDVEQGEVFALLGPNGAGKTTTVEILEGFRRRDAGEVSVLGVDPARPGAGWRARIGIVLQSSGGHDELTVQELVHHFAGYYPDARDPDEVIAAVGLDEKRATRARHLSGGQRRRLDVALGILGNPALLFLDEPTTGFDPEARREFWALIRSLAGGGTTIILTTHYLDEAEHLAGRVGVITGGRIVALGSPATLGGRDHDRAIVGWTEDGRQHTERTAEPTAFVTALAHRLGGEVPGLTVSRPTLEDVYLRLIDEPSQAVEVMP